MKQNFTILGAGLSGLTAATLLAKAGYTVHLHERVGNCGVKFHSEFLGLENWTTDVDVIDHFRNMGLLINFDVFPFSHVHLFGGDKHCEVNTDRPLFYLIRRGTGAGTLDTGLKKQALRAGVRIHFNSDMKEENADIVATGTPKPRLPGIPHVAGATGVTFRTTLPDMAVLVFNDKLAENAYAYLLVANGHATMMSVVVGDLALLPRCFHEARFFFESRFGFTTQRARHIGGVADFRIEPRYSSGRRLLTGEAAGLQDILWGFGMRFAVRSGYLAARSFIEGFDYPTRCELELTPFVDASVVNRFLWENIVRRDYAMTVRHPGIFKALLAPMHRFNKFQRLIYPLARLYLADKYPTLD